jgi:uncharacterized protein
MMTLNMTLPSYKKVAQALKQLNSQAEPSETHGLICGFISAGTKMDGKSWIEAILGRQAGDDEKSRKSREVILALYQASFEKLQSFEFDFEVLLPSDSESLSKRAEALSYWCQGYITGLDLAGIDLKANVSDDCTEALQHLLEISKLDYEFTDVNEADEMAFVEVSEYVRMATILIHNVIASHQSSASGAVSH